MELFEELLGEAREDPMAKLKYLTKQNVYPGLQIGYLSASEILFGY